MDCYFRLLEVLSGQWRFFLQLPDYAQPWICLSREDIEYEYSDCEGDPVGLNLKHVLRRYEGEVALAWHEWDWVDGPLPRDKVLWHPQYATSASQRQKLTAVQGATPGEFANMDLARLGGSAILKAEDVGHWRRRGGVVTLMELFRTYGQTHTAQELFFGTATPRSW